jgi:hypothetical protein
VSLGVAFLVFRGKERPWLAVPWLLAVAAFVLAERDRRQPGGRRGFRPSRAALLIFAAALPVLVRVANFQSDRMHTDEFMTGYFSATHDFAHKGLFGFIPEYWEWQGRFPKPFFFIQKVFFTLFGASTLTLRLSVQVYVAAVSVMLFLIVRELLDQKSALVAVVLYSFLAVSVYLETLGFMFISSTAIFTVFFYFALRQYRSGEPFQAALAGVACGFCYLTYYSSYLALPVLLVFSAFQWLRSRSFQAVRNLVISVAGMLVVLAPFAAFFFRSENYVTSRAKQVSLLTGEWSPYSQAIQKGATTAAAVLRTNTALSLKSFFRNGIGGHGGYDFGRLALFDRFSFVLFLAGLLAALVLMFRKSEIFFVLLVIGASFLTGMALTIPPPAYHRFSIAFPFLVIVMTLPFFLLFRLSALPRGNRLALAAGLLLLFACVNERYFVEATIRDIPADELRLSELINQRYDNRNLYVGAFDAFAFQKIFYFRDRWKNRRIRTTFHDKLLQDFSRDEKYVYVMILGDVFRKRFQEADPKGRFIRFSQAYSLFVN